MSGTYGVNAFIVELDDDGHLNWPLPLIKQPHKRMTRGTALTWQAVLQKLLEAPVRDAGGRASAKLAEAIGWTQTLPALSGHVAAMEQAGLVARELNGKRCFTIALAIDPAMLPPEWSAQAPEATQDATAPEATHAEAPEAPEASEGHTAPEPEPAPADEPAINYDQLATALLQRVIDLASQVPADDTEDLRTAQIAGLSAQLTNAHNTVEKLRKRIDVLERDAAVRSGLLKATRVDLGEERRVRVALEANLQGIVGQLQRNGNTAFTLSGDEQRILDRLMRELPVSPMSQHPKLDQ